MLPPSGSVDLSGFRELDDTFYDLGKTLGRGILRRVGIRALEPMAEKARENVPEFKGYLKRSIHAGSRLAKSQRSSRAQRVAGGGDFRQASQGGDVTVHMGPGQDPAAIQVEFGNHHQAAEPFMRPAFDAEALPTIQRVANGLWPEIEKTADRRARKLAKKAGR